MLPTSKVKWQARKALAPEPGDSRSIRSRNLGRLIQGRAACEGHPTRRASARDLEMTSPPRTVT